jgi:hypothetical protein
VQQSIGEPLVQLRDKVGQELLRRQSPEAMVPIDREPVPPEYADRVRRYYERLGAGGADSPSTGGSNTPASNGIRGGAGRVR